MKSNRLVDCGVTGTTPREDRQSSNLLKPRDSVHIQLKSPDLEVITEMKTAQENQQDQPLFTEGEDQRS